MSKTTIQWSEYSLNPFRARDKKTGKVGHMCEKISPGCKNCYASQIQRNTSRGFHGHEFLVENQDKVELFLDESKLLEVLKRKKPTVYFWCNMTDMFWEKYPGEWIDACFAVMALTPWHTHQVLTKRADRMHKYFRDLHPGGFRNFAIRKQMSQYSAFVADGASPIEFPLHNVWLMVSAEDQPRADERIELLSRTPAAVKCVSYEPALGPINFEKWTITGLECECGWRGGESECEEDGPGDDPGLLCPKCGELAAHIPMDGLIDWVVIGLESGPGARPGAMEWAKSALEQCAAAGIAAFMKQFGRWPYQNWPHEDLPPLRIKGASPFVRFEDSKGGNMDEWPDWAKVREYPEVR